MDFIQLMAKAHEFTGEKEEIDPEHKIHKVQSNTIKRGKLTFIW